MSGAEAPGDEERVRLVLARLAELRAEEDALSDELFRLMEAKGRAK